MALITERKLIVYFRLLVSGMGPLSLIYFPAEAGWLTSGGGNLRSATGGADRKWKYFQIKSGNERK